MLRRLAARPARQPWKAVCATLPSMAPIGSSTAFTKGPLTTAMRFCSTDASANNRETTNELRSSFARPTPDDIGTFRAIVGETNVLTESDAMKPFVECWFRFYTAREPSAVLFPRTTEELSQIMRHCHDKNIAVVPQGGNTNFVGAAVPVFDEVVISLKRMNSVLDIDTLNATVVCEAGCILESLDETLQPKGLMMPVDLGAKGSCHIGGNVSTNAGGLRFMRYGTLHGNVLGVRAVLADGEVMDLLTTSKKDNTGYDLKQLFIGSEGTLGIITHVAVQLAPKPQSVQTLFLGLTSWENVELAFRAARAQLGEILSAVEMIDGTALDMCIEINKTHSPLESRHTYYLLLETNGSNTEHDAAKLDVFLQDMLGESVVADGTVADSQQQSKHIWSMREACAVAPNQLGYVRWYDICMPPSGMAELIDGTRAVLEAAGLSEKGKVIGFGHLGDGNLHLNLVSIGGYDAATVEVVDSYIYKFSQERRYSVSAEHGIGVQKRDYLGYSKDKNAIEWMRRIKSLFDPKGILNPYKVLKP